MMNSNPWRSEIVKVIVVGCICLVLHQIIGNWSVAITLSLLGYIAFIGFKLHEVLHWLNHGMSDKLTPESGGVMGDIITLIYRHKKSLEQSHEQQKAITQQFHDIISAIPSATIILNWDNEIEWANYPALLLLGVNGQRDVGIKIDTLIRQTNLDKILEKQSGEQFEISSPVDANMTLMVQIVSYAERKRLLIAHNITPHIELQRSRKTFIANASHELRTPLTVIAGYLEFVQSDPELAETLQQPIAKAVEQSANMQILINDLLTLSKLEARELKPDSITRIDLQAHLDAILQTLTAGGKGQAHTIITEVDEGLSIEASEKELNSVCYNLITNAIKYSEAGSEINISWQRLPDEYAIFSITDQGIGIAPEHIAHLTERFYRVDSGRSRRVGGTGLGLSIVKHIVERHHGRMEIHSRLGEGSTFSAVFPLHPLRYR